MKITFNSASFAKQFKSLADADKAFRNLLDVIESLKDKRITNVVEYYGSKIYLYKLVTEDKHTIYDVIASWKNVGGRGKDNYRQIVTILSRIESGNRSPAPGKDITIDGVTFKVPRESSNSMLLSLLSCSSYDQIQLKGTLEDKTEIILPNIAKKEHVKEHRVMLGVRVYEYNMKHSRHQPISYGKGKVASVMDLDDNEAQQLLNQAIYVDGTLCAVKDNQCYIFRNHEDVKYHGYLEKYPSDRMKRKLGLR